MIQKEDCLRAIKAFRAKYAIEAPDENIIGTIHLMNTHGMDSHAALDQSSRSANDHGIDAWFHDSTSARLFVYQSKLSESKATALRGFGDLDRARQWLEALISEGRVDVVPSDNHCLFNLYRRLSETRAELKQVHFVLVSPFDPNELEDSDEYQTFEGSLARSGLNSVMRARQAGKVLLAAAEFNLEHGVPERIKSYSIDKIPNARLGLRRTAHLDLAYVSLHSLVELYRQRGDVLFDKNVRLSLANNKEAKDRLVHPMEQTLAQIAKGELDPSIFAFYHIGVTIAAARLTGDETTLIDLEAPSIINGCQTVTIANEFLKKLERQKQEPGIEAFKQIKVIAKVVVGTTNDELKEITNSNNRQNPIENWQLFSNESIHIEIEAALKDRGVFYERQKGKFDAVMKNADNARHYHATNGTYLKVFDLAQVVALSRRLLPWAAKPSDVFLNKENHDKIFDKFVPRSPRDVVFTANLMKALKRGLNTYLEIPAQANSVAPQIFKKPMIRAHLYSLALLHFYQSANRQNVRDEFSSSLKKIAHPRLVEDVHVFCRRVVTRTCNWYNEESKQLSVEVSKRKLDWHFGNLSTELGVDFEGQTPFSVNGARWHDE